METATPKTEIAEVKQIKIDRRKGMPQLFKKGQSGNPKGKPKGTRSMTTMLREALKANATGTSKPLHAILIDRMIHKAIQEGNEEMIRFIFNHLDGMPSQKIDHTSGGEPITGFIYETPNEIKT